MSSKFLLLAGLIWAQIGYAQNSSLEEMSKAYLSGISAKAERGIVKYSNEHSETPVQEYTLSTEETLIASDPEAESEISAVSNPSNNNILVVAVMETTDNIITDETQIKIFRSLDHGSTWALSTFAPMDIEFDNETSSGGGDPVLSYDGNGILHLTWLKVTTKIEGLSIRFVTRVLHATSVDNGLSWTIEDQEVSLGDADIFSVINPENGDGGDIVDKCWIVSDTNPDSPHFGNLYVFYVNIFIPGETGADYSIRSRVWNADEGWGPEIQAIPFEELQFVAFPQPVITSSGEVHLMASGATVIDEFTALYLSSSPDGGQSYSSPTRISYWDLPCFLQPTPVEPCVAGIAAERSQPSATLHYNPLNEDLYAVWYADGFLAPATIGTDIYFSESEDNGTTWSEPIILNTDTDEAIDNFMPSAVVSDSGILYVTWYDNRLGDEMTQYLGIAYNGINNTCGQEFSVSSVPYDFSTVGNSNGNFGVGEYNTTLFAGDKLLPFWADGRSGDGNLNLYMASLDVDVDSLSNCPVISGINPIDESVLNVSIYPNPVLDQINLEFNLLRQVESVRFTLLDASGKMLRDLIMRTPSAGPNSISFETSNLVSGSYFITIQPLGYTPLLRRIFKN
ncbi:MAG: T9SS type A sorting domain-containing protein [Bacteroidota bacterium]